MSDATRPPDMSALLAHADFVRGLARSLVGESEADDLVQRTYLAALEGRSRPRRSPKAWLAGIVRNLARMTHRSEARRERREHVAARPEGDPSAADTAARMEEQKRLVHAVDALEEPNRTVVVLRYLDGLPPREIAARLRIPVRTVESRLRRSLERLRGILDRANGGDRRAWCLAFLPLLRPGAGVSAGSTAAGGIVMSSTTKAALVAALTVVVAVAGWRVTAGDGIPDPTPRSAPAPEPAGKEGTVAPPPPAPPPPPPARPEEPPPAPPEDEPTEPPPPEEPSPPPLEKEDPPPPVPPRVIVDRREPEKAKEEKPPPEEVEPEPDPVPEPPGRVVVDRRDPHGWPAPPVRPPEHAGTAPAGMAWVEGGTFEMGSSPKSLDKWFRGKASLEFLVRFEKPAHKVAIDGFFMDRFEVTNEQYRAFLDAAHRKVHVVRGGVNTLAKIAEAVYGPTDVRWWKALYHQNWRRLNPEKKDVEEKIGLRFPGGEPKPDWATRTLDEGFELVIHDIPVPAHWIDWGTVPTGQETHPVRWVSWVNASAYAMWAGKHLPTEAEWERAARGPKNHLRTWGGTWSKDEWNRKESRLNWAELPAGHPARSKDPSILTTPVGSFPEGMSPFGMFDLLGNVWEWTDSTMEAYPGSKSKREAWWSIAKVVRGGSWSCPKDILRTMFRYAGDGVDVTLRANDAFEEIGFRCAKWSTPGADRACAAWRALERSGTLPREGSTPIEFARHGGIGVESRPAPDDTAGANHVYVTSGTRAIAVLPRRTVPFGIPKDLWRKAKAAPGKTGIVVAVVHTDLELKVWVPTGDPAVEEEGTAAAGTYLLSAHAGRLQLLAPKLAGHARVGYLSSRQVREEPGEVVAVERLKRASSKLALGFDRVDIVFPVAKRIRSRDAFVFRASFHTAARDVIDPDGWRHLPPER